MDGLETTPAPGSASNSGLASLLATAYRDVESLRSRVASLQKRADKGDRLAEVLHAMGYVVSPGSSPSPQGPPSATIPATNGSANPSGPGDIPSTPATGVSPSTLPPQVAQQLRQVVEMYEEKLSVIQGLLEESEARNKDSWRQLDEILFSLQSQLNGARAVARPYVDSPASAHVLTNPGHYTLGYPYTDSPTSAAFPSISPGAMGPPAPHGLGVSSPSASRHIHSGSGGSGSGTRGPLNATAPLPGGTVPGAPVAFPLPPHPSASASTPSLSHSHAIHQAGTTPQHLGGTGSSTRRPRTPSMDNLYAIAQPPSKRSRAAAAAGGYDSYPPTASTTQHHRPLGPSSTVPAPSSTFIDPNQQPPVQARIIDRKYRSSAAASGNNATSYTAHPLSQSQTYAHPSLSGGVRGRERDKGGVGRTSGGNPAEMGVPQGPGGAGGGQGGHSRSASHSSNSSMDVDEMIIKATTEGDGVNGGQQPGGGGGGGGAGGGGARWPEGSHLANAHAHSFLVNQPQQNTVNGLTAMSHQHHHRRRSDRDRDRERDSPVYPQSGQSQSFTAGTGNGGSAMRALGPANSEGGIRDGGRSYTTVFTPVVTGPPTKKSKFPNSSSGVIGSTPSLDTLANQSASNIDPSSSSRLPLLQQQQQTLQSQQTLQIQAQGQPQQPQKPFPATNEKGERICRTCGIVGRYKDGKCVEKWGPGIMGPGTVCDRCRKKAKRDEGRKEQQAQQQAQQQQLQPRSNSHGQLPLSQGSDRGIQRSDTILTTHQPSTHSFIQSTGTGTFPSGSNARGAASARHAPTPPKIASLRENHDDDENDFDEDDRRPDGHIARERDPEQLPTSNVGRGVAAVIATSSNANNSRSNSRSRRLRPGSAKPTPPAAEASYRSSAPVATGKKGSKSPASDEIDADADADAEAEAEAEILGAVDAAAAQGDHVDTGDDADGDGDGDGDGEEDLENDADADAELLEAVDAAEANSMDSPHGGERWLKSEPN